MRGNDRLSVTAATSVLGRLKNSAKLGRREGETGLEGSETVSLVQDLGRLVGAVTS